MSFGKALLVVFCSLFAFSAVAQTASPDEAKILALEKMWNQAQMQHDAGALKALIGDRFVNTEWDGELSTREQFLATIADPKFDPAAMSISDVKIDFYGDTAIVIGIYHTKGRNNGKPFEHTGRFTDTWVKDKSAWKCVASHSSLIQK